MAHRDGVTGTDHIVIRPYPQLQPQQALRAFNTQHCWRAEVPLRTPIT